MKTHVGDRASAIFLALSHVPSDQRAAMLAEQCGDDDDLRREVERLLAGLDLPDSFMDSLDSIDPIDPIDRTGSLDSADARSRTGTPPIGHDGVSQPAGAVIGDFVVVRQIGAGGTGVVYLAHQRHPARIVALKVLRREFMASVVQRRFEIEAELLGHLHHPGIAQVYAAHPGDETTPPYIAMELVSGPPLTEFADSHRLSTRDRVELVARVCDAVQHAHQKGIIHRDLKPGNILVDEEGQPKVLDFGVARTFGAQVSMTTIETLTGQLLGTLAYMSPEQIEAAPDAIDTRTDIHAIGVILFRLLAGRLPFGHDDPPLPELARRIARDEPPRLGSVVPALRGDLEIIVTRALAKEKERRYASAASLASDLRRYLAGQPISASADSAWYIVRRRLQRYRLALTLTAAAVVGFAAVAFYASVQRSRADRANLQLQQQLATSTIERGRLLSLTGNLPIAEELAWREFFRQPDSQHAQWALWDIYSREPSVWTRIAHTDGTQSLRFSPDGRRLLTVGRADGQFHVIDLASRQIVRTLTAQPRSASRRAFFTPDGGAIVTGSDDGMVRVWDAETGAVRREIKVAGRDWGTISGGATPARVQDLAMARDGTHVVTLGTSDNVQVWSLATGQLVNDLSGFITAGLSVAMDPAGRLAIVGSEDGSLAVIDVARRAPVWRTQAHEKEVIAMTVDPRGRVLATGGGDGAIALWNLTTGERLRTIATENGRVRNVAFDDSGTKLGATGQWRTRLWDLDQPAQPGRDLGGGEGMTDLHVTGDARFLATCHGGNGLVRLFDLAADARTDRWAAHSRAITGLVVDATAPAAATTLVSVAGDGVVSRSRPGDAAPIASWQAGSPVNAVAISDNGQWIATVGAAGTAAVWDARSGQRIAAIPEAGTSRAVLFTDGDRGLTIGEGDGTLVRWDWADGRATHPRRTPAPAEGEVLALASRGPRLFVSHRERTVIVRDAATGREIRRMGPWSSPFSLAVTPDVRLIAAGMWVGSLMVYDAETGRAVEELKGPTALVTSVDFSPDGQLLAVASRDGSTRVWDVAARQWLASVAVRKGGAARVRFFPDGRRLAIGYEDGELEIRDLRYFFRYAAGHAELQLKWFQAAGESFPRAAEVLAWSRRTLAEAAATPSPLQR